MPGHTEIIWFKLKKCLKLTITKTSDKTFFKTSSQDAVDNLAQRAQGMVG